MLASNIDSTSATNSQSSELASALKNNSFLDKQDFLKLFVEQLKHQDPLNPMKNYEVASQLAQYSSLEQLVNINDNFKKLMNLSSMNSYFQGISLIGKEIGYEGDKFSYDPSINSDFNIKFKLNEETSKVFVNIFDSDNNLVKSIELDDPSVGDNQIVWDGKDSKGKPANKGIYKYEVIGYNENGDQVDYTPYGSGKVSSIKFDKKNHTALINVNNDEVDITKIVNVMN